MKESPIYGLIYVAENKINGKKYVGMTAKTVEARVRAHMHSRYPIGCALRKYGAKNFKWQVIDTALTYAMLEKKEIAWIAALDCVVPKGYNQTIGGDGIVGAAIRRAQASAAKARWNRFDPKLGCTFGEWFNTNREMRLRRGKTKSIWLNDWNKSAEWLRSMRSQKPNSVARSRARRKLWADPVRKAAWCEGIKASWTPEARAAQSERFKVWWAERKAGTSAHA